MMPAARLLTLLAVACALLVAACGSDEDGASATEGPTVVATTGFAADLVSGVAGDDADVVQLVPDSANPHTYSASAKDRATLDRADVVVAFGRGYEEGLPLDEVSAARLELADSVGELRTFAEGELPEGEHGHEDEGEHAGEEKDAHAGEDKDAHAGEDKDAHAGDEKEEHAGEEKEEHAGEEEHGAGASDPHVWMDPNRLAAAAPKVAEALAKADGANADAYRERARAYADELRALDREITGMLEAIPADRRKLVTSHESMGYFADRYRFDFVGAPFGLAPEAEASAQDIAEVVEQVREARVPAVFAQQGDDPKVMRRIADEAGVEVVDDLLVENPGPQGETYAEAMRHNARRIAEALGST
jgi:zinc/manganese transport system substrate-binding protein